MTARSDAQKVHERKPAAVLELDLDYCENEYGVGVCTAGRTAETGTAQSGGASTLQLRAGASGSDGAYTGFWLGLRSGAGSVQARKITGYVGATKVATVSPGWRTNALTKSSAIDHANWTKQNGITITTNYGAAPDGTMKADRVQTDGISLARYFQTVNGYAGKTVCFALKMRSLTGVDQNVALHLRETGFGTTYASQVKVVTTAWQTFSISAAIPGGSSGVMALVYDSSGVLVWDFLACEHQWNEGATPGEFIETDAAAITLPDATTVYDVIDRSNACYNVFAGDSPCQDPANYVKGVKTIKVCTRGMPIPAGEHIRPYLAKVSPTASEISTDKGLAPRSRTSVDMVDEPCRDDLDKYVDDRATPAGGTFWPRLLARNPNAAGRKARLRRGYVVDPWDWNTFQTELFIIEALQGPNKQDVTTAVLADLVKLLERTMIPAPTDGKLIADLAATSDAGTARGGSINTIVLREKASAIDDFYNGQEVFIFENTGAGQRRVISDYDGASRTATLATNWQVTPDALSVYEVAPLELEMPSGAGAQYPAPGAEPEFVRIGDEVIRYTAKSGDKLQWADGSYRAQFGTGRAQHKAKDGVQLCRAWVNKPLKTVAQNILNEGGVDDTYVDLTQLAKEDADWLGLAVITACIADPEKSSDLYADLLKDVMMMSWWHPVEQKVKFKVDMPELGGGSFAFTDDQLMLRETDPVRLDEERITRAAVDFELASATEDLKKRTSYRTIELFVDGVREGTNSYGDVRQSLRASRWFTEANEILAKANVARRLRRLGDAPWRIRLKLDPRDEIALGSLGDLTSRKIVTAAGNPKTVRCRVMRLADRGSHLEGELRTTGFQGRYAFIAPNGQPDYGAASAAQRAYWYISNGAVMSDGSPAYIFP